MPLLNYTTTVPVAKTVAEVQHLLVKAGARSVLATYDENGGPVALAFSVETVHGTRSFALPVRAERVHAVLLRDRDVAPRYRSPEQAERVAWRIVKDWVQAQLAIIATEMVTLDEVMLPYMHDAATGRTLWELYGDQQLAIGGGT